MTRKSSKPANGINGVENGEGGKIPNSQAHTRNSSPVGASSGPPVEGVLERPWRRKNNINSLDGLMREHGRLIRSMHAGKISLEKGEILSRAYGRHKEIVQALQQIAQLESLHAQLAALRGEPVPLPLLTAPRPADLTPVGELVATDTQEGRA